MQGFNMGRYVPPEHEGVLSFNQASNKKTTAPTVRFEMPYPIWCTTCPKPTIIGQGVRFNAIKTKVGNYYSTAIFSFRFKHIPCSGWIEIRTDPKNTAYVVTEGAKKRDTGDDKVRDGDVEILTNEERERRRADAFASLEVKVDDRVRLEAAKTRIEELRDAQERHWDDPYELNRRLRKSFRVGRKEREVAAERTAELQDRMSLGIDLLPENEDDSRRAHLVDFGTGAELESRDRVMTRPLFAAMAERTGGDRRTKVASKKTKAVEVAESRKRGLVAEITGNTRAKLDPFLAGSTARSSPKISLGVKRKRKSASEVTLVEPAQDLAVGNEMRAASSLVDYDSY